MILVRCKNHGWIEVCVEAWALRDELRCVNPTILPAILCAGIRLSSLHEKRFAPAAALDT
jgi:hypothetical protein